MDNIRPDYLGSMNLLQARFGRKAVGYVATTMARKAAVSHRMDGDGDM